MAPESATLTTKWSAESPYQLDKAQVSDHKEKSESRKLIALQTRKASSALLKHIRSESQRKDAASSTKNLLSTDSADPSDTPFSDVEPVWLVLTTKKHIVDQKRLKPGKIFLPHSLHTSPAVTICLITSDPQRPFKDTIAHPSFPPELSKKITRVIGISKLKARYKSFESRRLLLAEHDIFLADARIIISLPSVLGKVFYTGPKRPIPVNLEPYKPKADKTKSVSASSKSKSQNGIRSIAPPTQVAKEIERTISCAQIQLSPTITTAVRVGLATMEPEKVAENIEAVVAGMVEKFIPKGWRNLRAIHIKGPNTMALPVWVTEELWLDEGDVLEEKEAKEALRLAAQKDTERRGREGEGKRKKKGKLLEGGEMSQEMLLRMEKLKQQKAEAREVEEEGVKKEKKRKGGEESGDGGRYAVEGVEVKKAKKRKGVESKAVEL